MIKIKTSSQHKEKDYLPTIPNKKNPEIKKKSFHSTSDDNSIEITELFKSKKENLQPRIIK